MFLRRLTALGVALCLASSVFAQAAEENAAPARAFAAALLAEDWPAADRLASEMGGVAGDLLAWSRLRNGDGSFEEAQAFLQKRPDWPWLSQIAREMEGKLSGQSDADLLAFFKFWPARTTAGVLAHASALQRTGASDDADVLVAEFWRNTELSATNQGRVLDAHGDMLAEHHAARLDMALWRGWDDDARRMFPLVSADMRLLAEARIGLRRQVGNVDTLIARVPQSLKDDPGLAHARFEWRAHKGRWDSAKEMLLERSVSADSLGRPEAWASRRRVLARDELRDGDPERAYRMAAGHHLAPGASYADLEWLAGYIALTRLDNPEQALTHFQNHDDAVVSPISQGRAGYWKGRALAAMGDTVGADMEYTRGAAYQTSFYGLLAAEAAGLPFDVGLDAVPQQDWRSSPVVGDSLFQAGDLLLAAGQRNLAEVFWVHLAEQLGEHDAALLGQAAIDRGEAHLAVMIGKAVARRGAIVPVPYYPLHPLAEADLPVAPELALSIARRESEFDPVVVSGAGARGLMQVMPATAREVAVRLGLASEHSTARLTADPVYNAVLGTRYLAGLIEQFDGNIVMVSAGYNAGPSRPDRWMRTYGDPRGTDIEAMIDWIEGIPFRETRNYVMRVSESLPIFRARLGKDPLPVPFSEELLGPGLRVVN